MMMIFSLILSFSFMLLMVNQPLSLGFFILVNSLLLSVSICYQDKPWFGFILFLIYIGGMLVMFAYITALMPNLAFKNMNLWTIFLGVLGFWFILLNSVELLGIPGSNKNSESVSLGEYYNNLGISLFSVFNINLIVGLAIILLFILICVVKICYFNKGPLRPFK
uniref:NADH-ubiquinone oxidoreductase chain 6 n=1 Tax=Lepidozona coreanica TaxID=55527 RepID=A0A6G9DVM7_9MOLL|nr:NADH dehydrogenase subunit 6 [Lepidozona coreanica]QIP53387.1 NADH dehydrogenase subunit 6 [Lepidozona coreanica]